MVTEINITNGNKGWEIKYLSHLVHHTLSQLKINNKCNSNSAKDTEHKAVTCFSTKMAHTTEPDDKTYETHKTPTLHIFLTLSH